MSYRTPLLALFLVSAVITASAALAADGSTRSFQVASNPEPMHITGRVLRRGDLPGFVPKERRSASIKDVAAWNKVAPSGDTEARLRRAGFVAAVIEDLVWTKGSDPRGALSIVVRLGSAKAARAAIAQQVRDFVDHPGQGGVKKYTPFAVPGMPGSSGWTAIGNDGTSGHNIIFADGPFTYHVGVGWGTQVNDPPTRAQLIAAATILYKRVHGRPAP